MADQAQIDILWQGAQAWRAWRDECVAVVPNLQDVDMARPESGSLAGFDLRGCDLSRAKFGKSNLAGTDLRNSTLHDADLSEVAGLQSWQLAGADLSGAKLPGSLADLFKTLDSAKAISTNAQKLFIAVLAACLYSWLTIATTKDVNLVTNRASSPLPVIQTSIPIVAFFIVTPLLLLGVYLYFHFYLQKLWEELGSLPAIFSDGRPLQTKADPWLLSDLVRSHVKWLKSGRPFLSYLQEWVSILVAWWVVPITLLLFWARYLPRHDWIGTAFHIVLAGLSISAAVSLHRLAGDTLSGAERQPFAWKRPGKDSKFWRPIAVAISSAAVLQFLSFAAIAGVPSSFIPRTMTAMGYSPFADLGAADISVKPANWSGKTNADLDPVQGLQLNRMNLRYADLLFAFLPKTVLTDAHLEGAELSFADLRQAELAGARFDGARLLYAHLDGADLVGATLSDADLSGAVLDGADISYADFTGAKGLTPEQLASAQHKDEAIYDDVFLARLNLQKNNNTLQRQARGAYLTRIANSSSETVRILNSARRFGRSSEAVPLFFLLRTDTSGGTQLMPTNPAPDGGRPFTATELARLYNFPSELDGSGQTIGIIELAGGYRMSDLNSYFAGLGLKTPDITAVPVNGGKTTWPT